ncbi:MAG: OsmC family protein [Lysobacterales bacterium]|jgi:organic hydroperoxide reductase OsmC/OhrA
MQKYPHHYLAAAKGGTAGIIDTCSPGLANIEAMPPREFDGPGDKWSPETMLVASVANCFILTFRAVARASGFEWNNLEVEVVGVLDRVDRVTRFTEFRIDVALHVPTGTDSQKAHHLAERSESVCLVTKSLSGEKILNVVVIHDD